MNSVQSYGKAIDEIMGFLSVVISTHRLSEKDDLGLTLFYHALMIASATHGDSPTNAVEFAGCLAQVYFVGASLLNSKVVRSIVSAGADVMVANVKISAKNLAVIRETELNE